MSKTALIAVIAFIAGLVCREIVTYITSSRREVFESRTTFEGTVFVTRREVIRDSDGNYVNHGQYTYGYDHGQKLKEGKFSNGKEQGKWVEWNSFGVKEVEEQYQEGLLNGDVKYWHDNGKNKMSGKYRNGRRHGKFTWWNADGTVASTEEYDEGEPVRLAHVLAPTFKNDRFGFSIRLPKFLARADTPDGFVELFRGGDPPVEVAIIASTGSKPFDQFKNERL